MSLAPVSQEKVTAMTGTIWDGLCGPSGDLWRLPDQQAQMVREMMSRGRLLVADQASPRDRDLVGAGPNDHLLGLYTAQENNRNAEITVFANEAIAAHYDPMDIVRHEIGHYFELNHSSRVALVETNGDVTTVCADCERRSSPKLSAAPHQPPGMADTCPVCQLHTHMAQATMLLDGLRQRAHMQHQIPKGLGGTILLVRKRLNAASQTLPQVVPLMPNHPGLLRSFAGLLQRTQSAVAGMQTPESVSLAYSLSYRAWDLSYDIAHQYWLTTLYGSASAEAA